MHEGKHGILDDVEDVDDIFGTEEDCDCDDVCENCEGENHDHKH